MLHENTTCKVAILPCSPPGVEGDAWEVKPIGLGWGVPWLGGESSPRGVT